MNKIKLYITLSLCILVTTTNAQTLVGIYNQTLSIAPSNTVTNGSSISVTGFIQNKGTVTISNNVHVHLGIDTSTSVIPKIYWRTTTTYYLSNLLPSSTFPFDVTDVASVANAYKGGGGGTTVVI